MKIKPLELPVMFWRAVVNTINHDGIEHAGYLSFLTMLSLFPFLVFLVAILGVAGESEAGARFIKMTLENLPASFTVALRPRVEEIISGPPQGLLTFSILGAIWTASSAVEGIRTVLNRAYRVVTPPAYLFRRSLSILQLILFTTAVMLAMFMLVIAPMAIDRIYSLLEINSFITGSETWHREYFSESFIYIRYSIIIFILLSVVSYLYYLLPNIKQRWVRTLPGAALVVIFWIICGNLFASYLANFRQVNLIYGSLGSIIAFLVFCYLLNVIFIFGAEFNYLLEVKLGHKIEVRDEG